MKSEKCDLCIEREPAVPGDSAEAVRGADPVPFWFGGFDAVRGEWDGGEVVSLFCGEVWLGDPEAGRRLSRALRSLVSSWRRKLGVPQENPVLVAGLGTEGAAADSLGPRTADRVLALPEELRTAGLAPVCAVKPGIPRETGMDTARTVRAVAAEIGAGLVVTVDSLTARTRERLGRVIQLTDRGVVPGSALGHSSGEISRETMPCPVLSLGVPTVIRSDVLTGEDDDDPLFVSRADTDRMVAVYARILASALNGAFSGNDPEEGISAVRGA